MKLSHDQEKIELSVEISKVLELIPARDIRYYAKGSLDMIDVDDADEHCECEPINIKNFDDKDLIEELEKRGYTVLEFSVTNNSIIKELTLKKIEILMSNKTDIEFSNIIDNLI